jgi:hypothetical protein
MTRSVLSLSCLFALCLTTREANAQLIFLEEFDGGASTTGFTVDQTGTTDCRWEFAPDSAGPMDFSVDFDGFWPAGPGFDSSFVFLDSDACGGTSVVVDSYLYSAEFDASVAGFKVLSFSHQFRSRLESFIKVEAFDGTAWNEVYMLTGADIGYPNPAVVTTLDITDAVGTSTAAQLRFEFNAGWDWWWALDSIRLENVTCVFPDGLTVNGITTSGADISWTDNGNAGYEWVITDGALPDGSNAIASGTGTSTTATGLASGTAYTVFVRSICDGVPGGWSGGVGFTTLITNDGCETAVTVPVNEDLLCGLTASGTVSGATASGVTTTCLGTPDDDVWFTFTATATAHHISLIDITGSTADLYMAVWTGPCTAPVLVPNSCSDPEELELTGLTAGETYYLQVYTWTDTPEQTSAFAVCIGTSGIGMGEHALAASLLLYPDPATERLSMRGVPAAASTLRVLDMMGREMRRERIGASIDVRFLVPGTYTVMVQDRDGSTLARARFVKQ